eukprot:GILJ01018493.1.p1 GENE.GILJ01018493.1~~GILJ01018493.1.p1  ORF type:complete len:952 (+),score=216.10 GILJ01018493.1:281-2857(+)
MDSLKKVSESAKVKIKASQPAEEFIYQIVKTAVRSGCEKAFVLMDKNTFLDAMTTHANMAARPSIELLRTLPQELRDTLGPALGLTRTNSSEYDMWERIVAMGLLGVLNNLRIRPLKKITQELGMQLEEMDTTEKYCEAILFAVFPKEKQRIKNSKRAKKNMGVAFNAPAARMRCIGNMGLIAFKVLNISKMRKDTERHYSPEFEFGSLKWSLLCMANKDSLALYLCQTGTVYCKFFIQLINAEPDDTIGNEGTQRFTSASQENDWGFNNIIKFDQLLDQKQGFWDSKDDSILIELGIVFVETAKGGPAATAAPAIAVANQQQQNNNNAANNNTQANNNNHNHQNTQANANANHESNKSTANANNNNNSKKANKDRVNEDVAAHAAQLLEQERLEKDRKRVKTLLTNAQKDEERLRKEINQKGIKTITDLIDSHKQEVKRILKEQKEAERREQQERAREQERIQKAQELDLAHPIGAKTLRASDDDDSSDDEESTARAAKKKLRMGATAATSSAASSPSTAAAPSVIAQRSELGALLDEAQELAETASVAALQTLARRIYFVSLQIISGGSNHASLPTAELRVERLRGILALTLVELNRELAVGLGSTKKSLQSRVSFNSSAVFMAAQVLRFRQLINILGGKDGSAPLSTSVDQIAAIFAQFQRIHNQLLPPVRLPEFTLVKLDESTSHGYCTPIPRAMLKYLMIPAFAATHAAAQALPGPSAKPIVAATVKMLRSLLAQLTALYVVEVKEAGKYGNGIRSSSQYAIVQRKEVSEYILQNRPEAFMPYFFAEASHEGNASLTKVFIANSQVSDWLLTISFEQHIAKDLKAAHDAHQRALRMVETPQALLASTDIPALY